MERKDGDYITHKMYQCVAMSQVYLYINTQSLIKKFDEEFRNLITRAPEAEITHADVLKKFQEQLDAFDFSVSEVKQALVIFV